MDARKYFIKLSVFLVLFALVSAIWDFAGAWRTGIWIACGVLCLLAIFPAVGRPLHSVWRAYLTRTSQDLRFFQGLGLLLLLIGLYRFLHVANFRFVPGTKVFSAAAGDHVLFGIGGLAVLGLTLFPPLVRLLFQGWLKLAEGVQFVMSRVVLALVYILTVLPIGLGARVFGKQFLDTTLDGDRSSYWEDRPEKAFSVDGYRRHF